MVLDTDAMYEMTDDDPDYDDPVFAPYMKKAEQVARSMAKKIAILPPVQRTESKIAEIVEATQGWEQEF
jgi:hypothetical protein